MELNLKGKKAVITGATRGIGLAVARSFAAAGVDVGICARSPQPLAQTVQMLRGYGVNIAGETIDVGDGPALKDWITRVGDTLDGIDILVSNLSAFGIGNAEEDWRRGFEVDLMGTVRSVEAALPYLEQAAARQGDAAIITLSSAASAITDYENAYGAYKAALIHYTKGLARRLAGKRIRANSVSPGTIYCQNGYWENVKNNLPDLYKQFLDRNPMGRMGEAQEVANVVVMLASPLCAFTTGVNVTVDGALSDRVNFGPTHE